jgi:hypothetical protein
LRAERLESAFDPGDPPVPAPRFRLLGAGGRITETSRYFQAQPGFVSLRLHRAVTPDARYRFVNVAQWATAAQYRAPHLSDEFRLLITQEAWREFPSTPPSTR